MPDDDYDAQAGAIIAAQKKPAMPEPTPGGFTLPPPSPGPNPAAIPLTGLPPSPGDSAAIPFQRDLGGAPPPVETDTTPSKELIDQILRTRSGPLEQPATKTAFDWGTEFNVPSALAFPPLQVVRNIADTNFGRDLLKGFAEKATSVLSGGYSLAQLGVDTLAKQFDPALFYQGKTQAEAAVMRSGFQQQYDQSFKTYQDAINTGQFNSQGHAIMGSALADLRSKIDGADTYIASLKDQGGGEGTYQTRNPVAWALSGPASTGLGWLAQRSQQSAQAAESALPTSPAAEASWWSPLARMAGGLPIDLAALSMGAELAVPEFALQGYHDTFASAVNSGATPDQARLAGLMGMVGGALSYPLFRYGGEGLNLKNWATWLAGRPGLTTLMDMSTSAAKTIGLADVQNGYNNWVAQASGYDPNRPFTANMWESTLQGTLLDLGFNARRAGGLFSGMRTPRLTVRTGEAVPGAETTLPPGGLSRAEALRIMAIAGMKPEVPATAAQPAPTVSETLQKPPVNLAPVVPPGASDEDHVKAFDQDMDNLFQGEGL